MLSPYTNLGSRGFVWSAKAKHVKEMICSVSLEEDFLSMLLCRGRKEYSSRNDTHLSCQPEAGCHSLERVSKK